MIIERCSLAATQPSDDMYPPMIFTSHTIPNSDGDRQLVDLFTNFSDLSHVGWSRNRYALERVESASCAIGADLADSAEYAFMTDFHHICMEQPSHEVMDLGGALHHRLAETARYIFGGVGLERTLDSLPAVHILLPWEVMQEVRGQLGRPRPESRWSTTPSNVHQSEGDDTGCGSPNTDADLTRLDPFVAASVAVLDAVGPHVGHYTNEWNSRRRRSELRDLMSSNDNLDDGEDDWRLSCLWDGLETEPQEDEWPSDEPEQFTSAKIEDALRSIYGDDFRLPRHRDYH